MSKTLLFLLVAGLTLGVLASPPALAMPTCRSASLPPVPVGSQDIKTLAQEQARFKNPWGLLAMQAVLNRGEVSFVKIGEPYLLTRSQNSAFGLPSAVPLLALGEPTKSPGWRLRDLAYARLLSAFENSKQKLEPRLLKIVRDLLEEEMKTFNERFLYYLTMNPKDLTEASSFVQLHDFTTRDGKEEPSFIERILSAWYGQDFRLPERESCPACGFIELMHAHKNPDPDLQELDSFHHLLREVGTYIDMKHLQRGRGLTVRFITSGLARRRLFERPPYGFVMNEAASLKDGPGLFVMEMPAAQFLKQFGSRWSLSEERASLPTSGRAADPAVTVGGYVSGAISAETAGLWTFMYRLKTAESFDDPLFSEPEKFRSRVQAWEQFHWREYSRLRASLQRGLPAGGGVVAAPYMSLGELGTFQDFLNARLLPVLGEDYITPILF